MAVPSMIYAKAVFCLAVQEKGLDKKVGGELQDFYDACKLSKELRTALYFPVFPMEVRINIVQEICKKLCLSSLTERFLFVLIKKNRMGILSQILEGYRTLENRASGAIPGKLRLPHSMPSSELKRLVDMVEKKLGQKVNLEEEEDKSLLGGFILDLDGKVFDASLNTQLDRLKEFCIA